MNLGLFAAALPSALAALSLLAAPAPATRSAPVVAPGVAPGVVPAQAPVAALAPAAVTATAQQVVDATNAQRAAVGAGAVRWNACLQPFSERWAATLAGRGALAHQDLQPILTACALSSTGENVAMGYDTASAVMTGWMNSPGHRANILNPAFTQIAIGLATDGAGRRYWTMNLGAGASTPQAPAPTPTGRTHAPITRAWTALQPQR